jgi:hypothetical protein
LGVLGLAMHETQDFVSGFKRNQCFYLDHLVNMMHGRVVQRILCTSKQDNPCNSSYPL